MSGVEVPKSDEGKTGSRFEMVPLLVFVVIFYVVFLLFTGVQGINENLQSVVLNWHPGRGQSSNITVNDVFILAVFVLLFQEILRAAYNDERTVPNHIFSFIVMLISLYAFFLIEGFGTSAFMFISLATVFDVVAGVYITMRAKPLVEPPIEITVKRSDGARKKKSRKK